VTGAQLDFIIFEMKAAPCEVQIAGNKRREFSIS